MMISDRIWQRSDLLGTQVITRTTGKRLGVVSEVLVDVDRREVVALGLRDNALARMIPGVPNYMLLTSIRQIGDVILVDDENAIADIDIDGLSRVIRSEVITEAGELLGQVRGFKFNVETGKLESLLIDSLGIPAIPEQLVSTYELPVTEIVSSGPDRIIVFEGAEERLNQVSVGVMERLGIGAPPWERDEEEEYVIPTTPATNQLGTGAPVRATSTAYPPARTTRAVESAWSEDDWEEEPEPVRRPLRQAEARAMRYEEPPYEEPVRYGEAKRYEEPSRYPESRRYEDDSEEEAGNWDDAEDDEYDREYEDYESYDERDRHGYTARTVREPEPPAVDLRADEYEDLEGDAWADEEEPPHSAQPLNLPKKQKAPAPEYEDGGY